MTLRRWFVLAFLLILQPAIAQKTAIFLDPDRNYREGLDLFGKQKYGAAREYFEAVLKNPKGSQESRMGSAYFIGACAAELFHKDAEARLEQFLTEYPESPYYQEALYVTGNYLFRQKKYKKSADWFGRIDMARASQERKDEVNFKTGYGYYMTNDYDKASRSFYAVKDGNSKYASAARYYYAHMAYVNQNYETALKEFLKLRESEAFAPVAPYYITQIYYKQGKYDEILKFAPGALDSNAAKNGMEISRMVAESFYRKEAYADALPYLSDYEKNSGAAGRGDWYQLAYCYYRTNRHEAAIPYFQKVIGADDSLTQNAYYHLADCYLKTNARRSARTSFQSAGKSSFDPEIQEESRFAYAKLSYELNFQSAALEAFRTFTRDFPNSAHVDEANELLVGIYANTRNYKDALTAIEAVKNKTPYIKAAYQKVAYYRGVECYMDNQLKDAVTLFATSLKYPVDQLLVAEAQYWKGEALYRQNDFDGAVRAYNDYLFTPAAVKSPRYNLANYNVGYANFKRENYSEAQQAFRKYVKDKSQTDPKRYSDALLRVGDCLFMLKDQVGALDYYNQAISSGATSGDYALYQKGVILGVQGRFNDKILTLEKLVEKYPKSVYFDDAVYEIAQANLTIGKNEEALENFRKIITDYPSSSYVKKAELGEALVYYNTRQDERAMAAYKRIVEKYPNSAEARDALVQIKNISVAQNKVDDYLTYVKGVPNADVSIAGQDSVTYEAAELRYTQGNCEDATKDFDQYLKRFPDAIFRVNASYYRSDCLFRSKKYEDALEGYEYVISQPRSPFTEKSLLNAGIIQYRLKQYEKALRYYRTLESVAEVKENIVLAQAGQMRSSFRLNDYSSTIAMANRVLESGTSDKDLQNEANLLAGKSYFQQDDLGEARKSLSIVAKRTNSEMTAESKYYLAMVEFRLSNYKESQKLIFEIQNQVPSYDYWIAKGFILLGDNYLAQRDTFQAKETYKSIVDNYQKESSDPDDLKAIAQEKLGALEKDTPPVIGEEMNEKLKGEPAVEDTLEIK